MKQEVIQRLKQEKEQTLQAAYNEGYTMGKEDVETISYADLKECSEGKIPPELWMSLRELIDERVTAEIWERFRKEDIQQFKRGYLTAVQEFWGEVKEQL